MNGQFNGVMCLFIPTMATCPILRSGPSITNFYMVSDGPDGNELWVGHFTKDAQVIMGNDRGRGEQGMLISVSDPLCGSRCATGMDDRN